MLRYVNKQARDSSSNWVQFPADSELRARSILTEEDFSGEELGRIISQPPAESQGGVGEARAPRPAGSSIMDDERSKAEKAKEKFVDSLAPVQSVQDDIGGVTVVIDPSTGYTNFKTKYRPDGSVELEGSTDLVAAKDKAN